MTKKIRLLFILVLILSGNIYSQNEYVDSLKRALLTAKEDSNKAMLLQNISFACKSFDAEEGIKYGQMGLALSEKLNWKKGIAANYNAIGTNYKLKSDYPEALSYYQKSLTLYEDLGLKRETAVLLMNVGTIYRPLHKYDKALEYYKKALIIAESVGNKKLCGQLLGNMGVVYFDTGKHGMQLEVCEKALQLFIEIKDRNSEAWILSNIGDYYNIKGDYKKAMEYQLRALGIYEELGNISWKAGSLVHIGKYYFELSKQAKNESERMDLLRKSSDYFSQGKVILIKLGSIDYLREVCENLSITQEAMGDYKGALSSYKDFTKWKDSVLSANVHENITKLETKRELDLRDKEIEIEKLKKRTERIYLIGGIAFLIFIMGFIVAVYLRQKKSNKVITGQKMEVEAKQKEILDSIHYAKRIQNALLTQEKYFEKNLKRLQKN